MGETDVNITPVKQKGKISVGDTEVDGSVILKQITEKYGVNM
jgi:hypothetical protein